MKLAECFQAPEWFISFNKKTTNKSVIAAQTMGQEKVNNMVS